MAKILILDHLVDMARNCKDAVLFGESNFVHDSQWEYDVFFHGARVRDPYHIQWPVSMVVPILRGIDKIDVPIHLVELNKNFPSFNRFGVVNDYGLGFYDVSQRSLGHEVSSVDLGVPNLKYVTAPKDHFLDYVNNDTMKKEIETKIHAIDDILSGNRVS